MKAIIKGAVTSAAGALLLGASLALSSATVVAGATRLHTAGTNSALPARSVTCSKNGNSYCFTVQNTGTGSAFEATAKSGYGIFATSTNGTGVDGSTSSSSAYGVVGGNGGSGGIAVYGFAPSGYGVYGQSDSSYGVYGITGAANAIGSYGQNTAADGIGVEGVGGSSQSGSNIPDGVLGTVSGEFGIGVDGQSSGEVGTGVYGQSSGTGSVGGWFVDFSTGSTGLLAVGPTSSGNPIYSEAGGGGPAFYTDDKGDGTFDGSVTATGFNMDLRRHDGTRVSASIALAPRATIEDTGTARMTEGVGTVRFHSDFAGTLDISQGYQVFLTPDGDTRGLFVAQKYENGFIVRETERGRSTLYFDYRVVAYPAGSSEMRFPIYSEKRPHLPQMRRLPSAH